MAFGQGVPPPSPLAIESLDMAIESLVMAIESLVVAIKSLHITKRW